MEKTPYQKRADQYTKTAGVFSVLGVISVILSFIFPNNPINFILIVLGIIGVVLGFITAFTTLFVSTLEE